MKISLTRYLAVVVVAWTLCPCVKAVSSQAKNLRLQPESMLWLVGDSTLHPFTSKATKLQVTGTWDTPSPAPSATAPQIIEAIVQRGALKTLDVVIPVQSLKSKESSLDKNMYKALKEGTCPEIAFHLSKYEIIKESASEKNVHAKVSGTLSIACQEHPVTLEPDLTPGPDSLRVRGQYTLLMTDYGVKPPTMMLGTIKVKNPVVIHFDLQLGFGN